MQSLCNKCRLELISCDAKDSDLVYGDVDKRGRPAVEECGLFDPEIVVRRTLKLKDATSHKKRKRKGVALNSRARSS